MVSIIDAILVEKIEYTETNKKVMQHFKLNITDHPRDSLNLEEFSNVKGGYSNEKK